MTSFYLNIKLKVILLVHFITNVITLSLSGVLLYVLLAQLYDTVLRRLSNCTFFNFRCNVVLYGHFVKEKGVKLGQLSHLNVRIK